MELFVVFLICRFVAKKIAVCSRIIKLSVAFLRSFAERQRNGAVWLERLDTANYITHNLVGVISVLAALQNKGTKAE